MLRYNYQTKETHSGISNTTTLTLNLDMLDPPAMEGSQPQMAQHISTVLSTRNLQM